MMNDNTLLTFIDSPGRNVCRQKKKYFKMSKGWKHGSKSRREEQVEVATELNKLYKEFNFCRLLKLL